MKYKKISIRLLAVVFGLSVSFLLIEACLRLYYYASENFMFNQSPKRTTLEYYDNEIIGHMFVPNQTGWLVPQSKEYYTRVEINSHGWTDSEHDYKKPEDVYRILFLGDSFVENLQVDLNDRFFKQFEKEIKNYTDKKVEVVAMGRGNTGTAVQYLMLKNFGVKYKPDMVVHMFLTANDVKNNSPEMQSDPYLPYFLLNENNELIEIPHTKRSDRSNASVKEVLKELRIVELALSVKQNLTEQRRSVEMDGYPIDYHVYDKEISEEYQKAWEVTEKLIQESKRISEENGARYILVTLANNEQVNPKVVEQIKNTYPKFNTEKIDLEKPDNIITSFCEEQQLDCLHMLPYFREFVSQNPNKLTHNFYEGHWNQTGTDLASKFLIENLKSKLD